MCYCHAGGRTAQRWSFLVFRGSSNHLICFQIWFTELSWFFFLCCCCSSSMIRGFGLRRSSLANAQATSSLRGCYFCFFRHCHCRRCVAQSLSVIPCVARDPSTAALVASTPIVAELSLPPLSSHLLPLAPLPSNLNSLPQFFSEQQLEGDYRQLHSRLRTHLESIAFYGGEMREEAHIQQKFKTLVRHLSSVLHDHWWFGMIQDFLLKYFGATVAVILIIEPFFSGHLSGYADRIHELMAVSRELSLKNEKSSLQRRGSRSFISEANYIEFSGVKKGESDSLRKFPSKSCPLRYGTTKIQEDALTLFQAALREFLGFCNSKTHGNENNNWGVTSLSVSASKIVPIPSVGIEMQRKATLPSRDAKSSNANSMIWTFFSLSSIYLQEPDTEIYASMLDSLNECLQISGMLLDESQVKSIVDEIKQVIAASSSRKRERAERTKAEDFDAEESELIKEENEQEEEVFDQVGEILETLIKTFKASFLPFFDELSSYLTPILRLLLHHQSAVDADQLEGSVTSLSNLDDSDSSKYLVRKKVQESLENLKEEAVVPKRSIRWQLGSSWIQHLQKQETSKEFFIWSCYLHNLV
ncbi:ABC transporter D family member [Arachis hypogaea]|nr:ABC transporter D family member [Arachis hypogaea]